MRRSNIHRAHVCVCVYMCVCVCVSLPIVILYVRVSPLCEQQLGHPFVSRMTRQHEACACVIISCVWGKATGESRTDLCTHTHTHTHTQIVLSVLCHLCSVVPDNAGPRLCALWA